MCIIRTIEKRMYPGRRLLAGIHSFLRGFVIFRYLHSWIGRVQKDRLHRIRSKNDLASKSQQSSQTGRDKIFQIIPDTKAILW